MPRPPQRNTCDILRLIVVCEGAIAMCEIGAAIWTERSDPVYETQTICSVSEDRWLIATGLR